MELFTAFTSQLQTVWDQAYQATHPNYPFYSYDWHRHWSTTLGAGKPLLIYAHQNALLPLFQDGTVARFTGGDEVADYLDILGPPSAVTALLDQALVDLTKRGITSLNLANIPQDSPLIEHFKERGAVGGTPNKRPQARLIADEGEDVGWGNNRAKAFAVVGIKQEDTTPLLTLPKSWDDYLASLKRKLRKEIKRKLKRFQESYPQVQFVADPNVGLDPDTIFTLMAKNPDKKTFLTPEMKAFFKEIITLKEARTVRLEQGDQTIAFKLYFQDQSTVYLYNSGYDPAYNMAGVVLVANHIQYAISQDLTTYNFLQGSERYKYDFGATDFPVYRLTVDLTA